MRYDKALGAFVELAASRHNAIHSSEAAEIHITTERLRRAEQQGHLKRLHPRVWAFADLPSTPKQTLRGAVMSISAAAATTTSAAWLHGWFDHPPPRPQLWVPDTHTRNHPVADLRRWSRLDPTQDLVVVDEITTLNQATALCSLGPHVRPITLERCLDDYLRSNTMRWLTDTMDRLRGRKPGGVAALQRILDDPGRVDGVTDSWFERVVANLVALPWMPPIELQHQVVTPSGRYRLDIACPEIRLGVEAHSRSFHWGQTKVDADNVRDLHLTAQGWQVLYVTWSQTRRPTDFVRLFAQAARVRATQLGVELPAA